MAAQTKTKAKTKRRSKATRDISLRKELAREDESPCNDTLSSYSETIEVRFGEPQPRSDCGVAEPAQIGAAMNEAKNKFKEMAKAYCAAGTCPDPNERFCVATTSNIVAENLGVSSQPEPNHPGQKFCTIKFKVTGTIACNCARNIV